MSDRLLSLLRKRFLCLNKYKIVGKGLDKVVLEVNCLH